MLDYKALSNEIAQSLIGVDFNSSHGGIVTLPLLYPSGSWAAIEVAAHGKEFFVSDLGGAYNEASIMGASVKNINISAEKAVKKYCVSFDKRQFFSLNTNKDELIGTIILVANASKYAVEQIHIKFAIDTKDDLFNLVGSKLEKAFFNINNTNKAIIKPNATILGSTNEEWTVDFLVEQNNKKSVFEAVSPFQNSVTSTISKFYDMSYLPDEQKPQCIAVVENTDKTPHFNTLRRNNRIILSSAPPEDFLKVA